MPEFKIDYKQIILRVAVFLAMLISSAVSTFQSFNLLLTADYGIDMTSLYSTIRWFMPPIMAIFYYFLYRIYINILRTTLNSKMGVFDRAINTDAVRAIVDPYMIALTLYITLVNVLFMFFPLYENVLKTFLKVVGVGLVIYGVYERLNKNLEKIFRPVIFWGMQLPMILLVILV